jgi:hypothetical protein
VRRAGRERAGARLGVAAGTLLILLLVPLWPWRPACRCHTQWTGDLRDVYVDYVAKNLDRSCIFYWRFGDIILIRFLPWLDGEQISTRGDAIFNTECKVGEMLSEDVTLDGVLHRAPEAVDRLRVEMAARIGADPRFAPDGTRLIAAMNAAPVGARRWCRRLLLGSLVVLLVRLVVPLWPWRPTCRCQAGLQGELRDVYIDLFAL